MKVTVIPFVTGALGTVTKGLVQGWEDSRNKPSASANVKNSNDNDDNTKW